MSDLDFIASVLADGDWHSLQDIISQSVRDRGCGLTVHSRVSDLRLKRGWIVEQRSERTSSGRVASFYRMLARPLDESDTSGRNHGFAPSGSSDSSSGSHPSSTLDSRVVPARDDVADIAPYEPLQLFIEEAA